MVDNSFELVLGTGVDAILNHVIMLTVVIVKWCLVVNGYDIVCKITPNDRVLHSI